MITWGDAASGGDSSAIKFELAEGVAALRDNMGAFAALKESGAVTTWGDKAFGHIYIYIYVLQVPRCE